MRSSAESVCGTEKGSSWERKTMADVADQSAYTIAIARSATEIESLRPSWRTLLDQEEAPIFNAEPDRLLALVGIQRDATPLVILAKKHEQPAALVVASIEKTRIRCSIGYKSFLLPPLRCLSVIHGGLLGRITDEVAGVLLDEMKRLLRSSEVDAVFFHYLNTDSSVYKKLPAKVNCLCRSHFYRVDIHRTMTVPESLDAFYRSCSSRHRANLRRYARKLHEQYDGRLVITRYTDEDSVDEFIENASRVSATTYQHALGSGLNANDSTRTLLKNMARNGWLRGHVMYLDGEPAAFQYGAAYREKLFLEMMGFDPKWKHLRIGTTLFIEALQDLCADKQAKTLDFGFGEAEYKRSYGDKHWTDAPLYLFAPRVRPVLANLVHSSTTGLSMGLARVLEKTGLVAWIKRRWRNRLQKGGEDEP